MVPPLRGSRRRVARSPRRSGRDRCDARRLLRSIGIWLAAALAAVAVAACGFVAISSEVCALSEPAPSPVTPQALLAEQLLRRWAPTYVQHVDADDRGADRPTRIDFDGDWDTTNNWDHQLAAGAALPPAIYGAAILTPTRAFLTYTLYYPRDWNRRVCVPLICHDNDLETVLVVVERDGRDGRVVEVRTKAHHAISETTSDALARTPDARPLLRVESGGHGVATCRDGDAACRPARGRIVYALGATASAPPGAAVGQTVRYELVALRDTLWARRAFSHCRLWTSGETGPLSYLGARQGRLGAMMGAALAGRRYFGGVRPPWAIKGAGGRGDWFLDPARGTEPYVFNPFLDDLRAECAGDRCPASPPEPSTLRRLTSLGVTGLLVWIGVGS